MLAGGGCGEIGEEAGDEDDSPRLRDPGTLVLLAGVAKYRM